MNDKRIATFQLRHQTDIPEAIHYIAAAGHSAPSADNTQPWCFEWNGQALSLKYFKRSKGDSLLDEKSPATLMALGAAAENMITAADALGENVLWSFPFESSGSNVYLQGQFDTHHKNVVAADWEHTLFRRHTNRLAYKKKRISHETILKLESLSMGSATVKVFYNKDQIKKIAHLVKQASSIRFRLQEVHEWFVESLRFTEEEVEKGDGLDIKTLPLPPGGRALLKFISPWPRMSRLNSLGLYKLFAHLEAQPISSSPAIIAINSPLDREALFNSGRLLEKVWCQLTSEGLAAQPYFVLSDQLTRSREKKIPMEIEEFAARLNHEAIDFFNKKDSTVQILLRIGYPSLGAVNSRRKDLDEVLIQKMPNDGTDHSS